MPLQTWSTCGCTGAHGGGAQRAFSVYFEVKNMSFLKVSARVMSQHNISPAAGPSVKVRVYFFERVVRDKVHNMHCKYTLNFGTC